MRRAEHGACIDVLIAMSRRLDKGIWLGVFDNLPIDIRWIDVMLDDHRWQRRLLDELAGRLTLPAPDSLPMLGPSDRLLAVGSGENWRQWRLCSGLSWWAPAIAGEVRGETLRALDKSFGAMAVRFVREWRDDSTMLAPLPEALNESVATAGRLCVGAWQQQLPEPWQPWMALVEPPAIEDDALPYRGAADRVLALISAAACDDA